MRKVCNRRIIFCFYLFLFFSTIPVSAADQRTALVIGNSRYLDAPLRNPANDAADMATALKKLGFSVTLAIDADQRTMKEAIRLFGQSLQRSDVGLFYFAGHGIQYDGCNYLIPVKAQVGSEADVGYEAVDAGRVLAQMERAGNPLNIIILDACRNNPFARSFRSSTRGLAKMDAPVGSILAYATAPGSIAVDGSGRNGLYTGYLLEYMAVPDLEIGRLFREVRKAVVRASGKKQIPWKSSSLMGDFYFSNTKKAASQPARGIVVREKEARPMIAAIAPSASGRQEMQHRYRMAIFPLNLYTSADNQYYVDPVEIAGIKGIAAAAMDEDRLVLQYCYRKLKGVTGDVTSLQAALKTDEINAWKRNTMFSPLTPDWAAIRKAGLEIGANPIVILEGDTSRGHYTCYLYDTQNDRIYTEKIETFYLSFEGRARTTVRDLLRAFFKDQ